MQTQQQWHYVDAQGQQAGPIPADVLQASVGNGSISPESLVWTEGMADWQPASSIEGMVVAAPAVAAVPTPTAVGQPQINLGPSLGGAAAVNPYSTPQANLGGVASVSPKMTMGAVLFTLGGRIPRRTYWGYMLVVFGIFYGIIFGLMAAFGVESGIVTAATFILYVPIIWISIALQCKRWHDRDKSGWWYFISWIPLVGPLWAFIELGCLRGTFGLNSYGEDPT